MEKKALFVAVHPDDETLGCGGTILKLKSEGYKIYWVIVTTTKEPMFTKEAIKRRMKIVESVKKKYTFDAVFDLGFPTIQLHNVDKKVLISAIDDVLNVVQPTNLYMMFNNDVHSDHRIAFEAVYSCSKSFRKQFIERIYMFEALSETEFAPALPSTSFIPNVYIDITPFMEQKLEIMKLYESEIMDEPYPRSLSSIEALARIRGSRIGVKYAESFMLLFEKK